MTTCAPSKAIPVPIIVNTPKRRIRLPVKNEGANIPSTCHWMTVAAELTGKPQICMANGVAVMTSIMMAVPMADPASAVIKTGRRIIADKARGVSEASIDTTGGRASRDSNKRANMLNATIAR